MTVATHEDLGIKITGNGAAAIARLDDYCSQFLAGSTCPGCESTLAGTDILAAFTATFVWGLEHGEGHCSICGWRARGLHRPRWEDGQEMFDSPIERVLAYVDGAPC